VSNDPIADAIAKLDPTGFVNQQGAVFIGIPAGSQTETILSQRSATSSLQSTYPQFQPFGVQLAQPYKTGTALDQLSGFGPEDIYALQLRLHQAGMLDNFIPNVLDKATRKAFTELLATANASRQDWATTLDQISTVGGMSGSGGATRGPLQVELTNPDDLKNIAQNVAQTLYGGNLPEEDLNRFVASYQSMQSGTKTQAYNTALTGGTVTAPPTAAVAAETQIRAEHPDQVAVTAFGNRLNDVIGGLIGPHYA